MKEFFWINVFITVAIGLVLGLVLWVILAGVTQSKIDHRFNRGEIDLGTYCDLSTDNGTNSEDIPVVCYNYYKIKKVGEKSEYNVAAKTYQTKPILEAE